VPAVAARDPQELPRQLLAEIIEPRIEEILELTRLEIEGSGYANLLAGGVVITGGSSILDGFPEFATQVFNLPVRRGVPQYIGGLRDVVNNPMFATAVGLVLYGAKARGSGPDNNRAFKIRDDEIYSRMTKRMREWFKSFFGL
jgi:cell division protein FtsA